MIQVLGCTNGGVPERAYEYIIRNGVSTDANYSYDQTESTVITPCNETRLDGARLCLQPGSVRWLCVDPYKYRGDTDQFFTVW